MEAGNRCFDQNVPEETNRKIIDHISDFNLVYTEHARRHLLSEGLLARRIYLTGSPMKEVLDYYKPSIDRSGILTKLSLIPQQYFLVSFHREENVDITENLTEILLSVNKLADTFNLPVIVSTHPRTANRLEKNQANLMNPLVQFMKPFGYHDYVFLQMNALCTLSDSGTISEESAILSFPAISIRQSMERPEAQDCGTIILSGLSPEIVLDAVRLTIEERRKGITRKMPDDYAISDTSWRVLKLILGLSTLSNKWSGIQTNNK